MAQGSLDEILYRRKLITGLQFTEIEKHRQQGLFSVRAEILFLILVSVLLFCAGAGIIIYNNIDTIGHIAILALLLAITLAAYFYSVRYAPGFSREKVTVEKPVYDPIVLTAGLLTGVFVTYLNVQYAVFGERVDLATLLVTIIYFASAYYFDHKGVLSLAIASLCAFVGFSATPSGIFHQHYENVTATAYYALATGALLILWRLYSERHVLKLHFSVVFLNFALHVICIASLVILCHSFWLPGLATMSAAVFYFMRCAIRQNALQVYTFSVLYAVIAATILVCRFVVYSDMERSAIFLSPFYFGFCIFLFIKSIRKFKTL